MSNVTGQLTCMGGIELFTSFPYLKIGNYIFDTNYGSIYAVSKYKDDWPDRKIIQLWYYYEQGVKRGDIVNAETDAGYLQAARYLERVTPYRRGHILFWLDAVRALSREGKINGYYLTVIDAPANPLDRAFSGAKNALYKATRTGTGLAVTGIILYITWPILKRVGRRTKRRLA